MNAEIKLHEETNLSEYEASSASLIETVSDIDVDCDEKFEIVKEQISSAKTLISKIESFYDPHVKRAHSAWKELTAERKKLIDPLKEVVDIGGRKNGAYIQAMREEEEKQRKAMEAAAKAEAEKEAREYAATLEARGEHEAAAEVFEHSKNVKTPSVHVDKMTPEAAKGTTTRTTWRFEVIDKNLVPDTFKIVNEKAIGALVRAQKDNANIPGVRVWAETKTT